jgi:serine/threonine protein kinase
MMIEYCPNGDGQNLLNEHIALNHQQNSYIPEPAIWHIFNSLIKAGLAMERVFASENDQDNARKLAEVVHLDIKPDNIFLGDYPQLVPNDLAKYPREPKPGPNNFAMYPTCKLGDFGLATYRRLAENQRNLNSNTYIGRGTPGFFAPEQKPQYHGRRPNLNAKTNVWGVGITVMALMNLNVYAGHLQFQQAATDESDPLLVPAFTPAAIAEYSPELRQMVQACVQYRQNDRPSFTSLLTSLRHYTGLAPGYRDHALGARFGTRKALPPGLSLLGGLPEQKYALRMVMPDS